MQRVSEQLQADLETTIAAETLSLRIGDRDAFLSYQLTDSEWQQVQSEVFEQYQGLGTRLRTDGEIIELSLDGHYAHVILREYLDDQPYRVTWNYEYREAGWQHAPPNTQAWGEQADSSSACCDFSFYEADRGTVETLAPLMDSWWETACEAMQCSQDYPRPQVFIEPDLFITNGWDEDDPWMLTITSPLSGRLPEDQGFDPVFIETLKEYIVSRWALLTVPSYGQETQLISDSGWVEREVGVWLHHILDPSAPSSAFFDSLVSEYGSEFIPDFTEQISQGQALVPALEAVTGSNADLLPVEWGSYIEYRLQTEALLIAEGFVSEAELLFRDPTLDRRYSWTEMNTSAHFWAVPASVTVLSTQRIGEVLMVEAQFRSLSARSTHAGELVTYEMFRLVNNRWVHTWPVLDDWGDVQVADDDHFTLTYLALDEPALEGLLSHLEAAFTQVGSDLGLPAASSDDTYLVFITPLQDSASLAGRLSTPEYDRLLPALYTSLFYLFNQENPQDYTGIIPVDSPYVAARPAGVSPQEHVFSKATWGLVERTIAGQVEPFPADHPIPTAIMVWELERVSSEYRSILHLPGDSYVYDETVTLYNIWEQRTGLDATPYMSPYDASHYFAARVLLDLLVDIYGPQVVPVLLENLSDATSLDDWLTRSVGIVSADIEADWLARYQAGPLQFP